MLQIFQLKYSNLKLFNEIDFIGTDETYVVEMVICRTQIYCNFGTLLFKKEKYTEDKTFFVKYLFCN